jgi:hypothetical protein
MKKTITFSFVLLVFAVLMSCKQEPAQMILGTWKLTNIDNSTPMNEIEKQMFKETNDELIAKEKYTFEADKLILTFDNADTPAAWTLGEDGKTLKITMSDGKEFNYDIVEFSESKLVWAEKIDEKFIITTSLEKVK